MGVRRVLGGGCYEGEEGGVKNRDIQYPTDNDISSSLEVFLVIRMLVIQIVLQKFILLNNYIFHIKHV